MEIYVLLHFDHKIDIRIDHYRTSQSLLPLAHRSTEQLKHRKACIVVIEHGMTPLSFQTALQKNEAKLSSSVQFENETASHRTL